MVSGVYKGQEWMFLAQVLLAYDCEVGLIPENIAYVSIILFICDLYEAPERMCYFYLKVLQVCMFYSCICVFRNPRWESHSDYRHLGFCVSEGVSTYM